MITQHFPRRHYQASNVQASLRVSVRIAVERAGPSLNRAGRALADGAHEAAERQAANTASFERLA